MALHLTWVFVFGILGNAVSFMVSLAPLPTFYQIYKKKTSEGFQSIPYVVSLFSAMLWIYYALLKKDAMFLITINTFNVFIQIFYIVTYFYYGPKKEKIVTVKLMLLFNVFGFGVIFLSTFFLSNPSIRLLVLGYICMAFALAVFAAPLAIVRKVIKTKSVEYMPFTLSVFLTLGAVMWFLYGLFLKDMNIAVPNILGFIFGVLQMILYAVYRNHPKKTVEESDPKLQLSDHSVIVDASKLGSDVSNNNGRDDALNKFPGRFLIVPWALHWKGLWFIFARYGNVVGAFIANKLSRRGKWFGFVRFGSKVEAERGMEKLNGFVLNGFKLSVQFEKSRGFSRVGGLRNADRETRKWGVSIKQSHQRRPLKGTCTKSRNKLVIFRLKIKKGVREISFRLQKWGMESIKVQHIIGSNDHKEEFQMSSTKEDNFGASSTEVEITEEDPSRTDGNCESIKRSNSDDRIGLARKVKVSLEEHVENNREASKKVDSSVLKNGDVGFNMGSSTDSPATNEVLNHLRNLKEVVEYIFSC
ncbi:Bidirectional sugar transporter SWEET14 [Hibiscus syriacus]|uniref:Bidirectional sugar transporter SWEET14 n=1 Tax=Hibiscus syriacus TaxID=106335 RepID=A0A6A2X554_HIBSY|nr:Bidirectional sugar transporter SWEET14 [Hibiscus syriacus]